jgi:hypothetical protein
MSITRGLREALIEAAAAGAADVRPDAVKDLAAVFVGVEALIQKMPQKTAVLRDAKSQRPRQMHSAQRGIGGAVSIFQKRSEVAHGGEPHTRHNGVLRAVDHLV